MKNIEYKSILPKRQVHLDFHTSPLIDGIGENFDGETFADTLKKADVESASEWKRTFSDVELSGNWAEDVIAIAKTQLGYRESETDFIIDDDGK